MAKLFGEYLVEKSLITEEQLLDALIAQIEEQDSVVKIVRDLNLMNPNEILMVLKRQVVNQKSFLDSAQEFSFWSPVKADKVFRHVSALRTPLGEILLKKKILDIGKLTGALDEYFGEQKKNVGDKVIATQVPTTSHTLNQSTVLSLSNVVGSYDDFFEFVGPNYYSLFDRAIEILDAGASVDIQVWKELCNDLHKMHGAAKLYDLVDIADFFEKSESVMREVISKKTTDLKNETLKKINNVFKDSKNLLKSILKNYQDRFLSSDFFSSGAEAEVLKSIYSNFTQIQAEISHLEKGA